ncbi:hypothetical protein BD410DRAFT_423783 [Rickenella mellea]|uniref:Uncharacterized protein n=1 Tax=Rickenella mellea TaxID=50990 RepID=A0A4Y7QKA4_9AGAM|nr:hypothetical protein BD410DRAFT_423783 [Rickenella mellea]
MQWLRPCSGSGHNATTDGPYVLKARNGATKRFNEVAREWERKPDASVERTEQLNVSKPVHPWERHGDANRRLTTFEGVVAVTMEHWLERRGILNAPDHPAPDSPECRTLQSTHMLRRTPLHETMWHRSGNDATRTSRRGRRASSYRSWDVELSAAVQAHAITTPAMRPR